MPYHRAFVIDHPGFWGRVGWLLPFVLFALVLALAAFAVVRYVEHATRTTTPPPASAGPDAALHQVRYRYATGQLSREEYFRLLVDLGAAPPPGAPEPSGAPPAAPEPHGPPPAGAAPSGAPPAPPVPPAG